ncbi:MAG: Hsp20/alpha crystallin family protein, partial [Betaproteobacteria bacterium]|nr:Hsp20/alpha crystallin family protein [Betaproteobacteria bacterium]
MNGITRYDPFNELTRFDPLFTRFDPFLDMEDMFNRAIMRPILRGGMETGPQIRMDVKEADGKYLVNAEIPGVNKDDIHVTV